MQRIQILATVDLSAPAEHKSRSCEISPLGVTRQNLTFGIVSGNSIVEAADLNLDLSRYEYGGPTQGSRPSIADFQAFPPAPRLKLTTLMHAFSVLSVGKMGLESLRNKSFVKLESEIFILFIIVAVFFYKFMILQLANAIYSVQPETVHSK